MAVGRRAGLPIQLINMPMQVVSKMRTGKIPHVLQAPGSGHTSNDTENDKEEEGEAGEEDLYIDVYGGGTIMNKSDLQ
jgi:N-formylglutamate amidohydrolase